jgi:hypothetical protein
VAWLLVLEQLIFNAEAEARWLDHCETMLVRLASELPRPATGTDDAQATPAPTATASRRPRGVRRR